MAKEIKVLRKGSKAPIFLATERGLIDEDIIVTQNRHYIIKELRYGLLAIIRDPQDSPFKETCRNFDNLDKRFGRLVGARV